MQRNGVEGILRLRHDSMPLSESLECSKYPLA
jgi:hypothetical protein